MMPDDLYSPGSSLPLLLKSRSRTLNCAYSARHTMSMAAGSTICLTISSGERSFVTRAFHRSSCICAMNLSAPSRFAIRFTSGGAAASGAASTVAPVVCSGCAGSGISIAAPASKPGGACAWKLPKPATCTTNGEPGGGSSGTTKRTIFGPSSPSGCETSTPSTGCRGGVRDDDAALDDRAAHHLDVGRADAREVRGWPRAEAPRRTPCTIARTGSR